MTDEEIGNMAANATKGVALLCRAMSDQVPEGAPRISMCAAGALGALVGIEAMVFGRAPTSPKEQDDFHFIGCLVLSRACTGVSAHGNLMGTEINFEPSVLTEAMDDFEKLTERKFDMSLFKSQWREALEEEAKAVDGLKSQFGQFFPQ